MLYFAYGSNLNLSQMSRRCPRATPLDKYLLQDARLVFRGVADVIHAEGDTAPGGLWRITPDCERALDAYEGFDPRRPDDGMYSKEVLRLTDLPDGESELMLYVMNSTGIYPPSMGYYNGIEQGYRDFGLSPLPLRLALKHAHDASHPSYVERQRTRRMGRPALAPRPVPKVKVTRDPVPLPNQPSEFVYRTKSKPKKKQKKETAKQLWTAAKAAKKTTQRSKARWNLDEWLEDRRRSGRCF